MRVYGFLSVIMAASVTCVALAQTPPGHFAGTWSGRWSNSLGENGESHLKLAYKGDDNYTGTWDDVPITGKRTNQTIELQGRTSTRSYHLHGTLNDGKLLLKYTVKHLDKGAPYKGTATLTRKGGGSPTPTPEIKGAPPFAWLDRTRNGFPAYFPGGGKEVILISLSWDGSMAKEVCQRAFDSALQKAKNGRFSMENPNAKSGLPGKDIYLFGYYSFYHNKGDWFAVFPGIRTSNGAPACERVKSNGERIRSTSESTVTWPLTNGQAVIVRFNSTRSGFNYRMTVANPDISIR